MGFQAYAAYDAQWRGFALNVSTQRTFGPYSDLASVTAAQAQYGAASAPGALGYLPASEVSIWDARPPKALDQISLSAPLPFGKTALSLSFINLVDADETSSRVLAASLTEQLPWSASLFTTVFVDFAQQRSVGLFAGLSIPLGADTSATLGASAGGGAGNSVSLDAQKTLQNQDGSYGWRIHDAEGATPYRQVDASYRSGYGVVDVGLQQQNGVAGGTAEIDGSVAALGDGVVAGNRIQDSFAVVDAGIAGVTVLQDNRPIGVTNPWGKLLVPDLRSYQTNKIGIDPIALPSDAEADSTQKTVVPAHHAGVDVDFGVKKNVRGAVVILVGTDGKFLPPGAKGALAGSDETFVVGYDGQAYVKGLADSNTIVAENGDAECHASFSYAAVAGKRAVVGPVTCR